MSTIQRIDRAVLALAESQHSAISRRQALECGLTDSMIEHRLKDGRFRRVYWRTYVTGGAVITPLVRASAALLHVGEPGVLSHHTGISVKGLTKEWPHHPQVLLPHDYRIRVDPRIRTHRTRRWHFVEPEIDIATGLRTACIEHLLISCAASSTRPHRTMLVDEALRRGMTTPDILIGKAHDMRRPGLKGPARIIRLLASRPPDAPGHRSCLETLVSRTLLAAGLHDWESNVSITTDAGSFEVDIIWRDARVVLEVDSEYHERPDQVLFDAKKTGALEGAGFEVLRTRYKEIANRPSSFIRRVRNALAGADSPP